MRMDERKCGCKSGIRGKDCLDYHPIEDGLVKEIEARVAEEFEIVYKLGKDGHPFDLKSAMLNVKRLTDQTCLEARKCEFCGGTDLVCAQGWKEEREKLLKEKNEARLEAIEEIEKVLNKYPMFSEKYSDIKYSENCFREMHASALGIIDKIRTLAKKEDSEMNESVGTRIAGLEQENKELRTRVADVTLEAALKLNILEDRLSTLLKASEGMEKALEETKELSQCWASHYETSFRHPKNIREINENQAVIDRATQALADFRAVKGETK